MSEEIKLTVTCYSGHKRYERPVRFVLGERRYQVTDIMDQWYGPEYLYFKVRADDGNIYILRCDERSGDWELEFFGKRLAE
jgi:hypothetical protein